MTIGIADAKFSVLLRSTIPLMVLPSGSVPPVGVRMRGVVRADPTHARIVLNQATAATTGVAIEYDLEPHGNEFNVAAAVDHVRFSVAPVLAELSTRHATRARDSHGNIIIGADEVGFDNTNEFTAWDQNIFRLLSSFVHGGGFPWFEEIFSLAGFMLTNRDRCRIYVRLSRSGATYGTELPLTYPDGRPFLGYAYLPQELATLIPDGDFTTQQVIDDTDDYCEAVVDMRAWFGPAVP